MRARHADRLWAIGGALGAVVLLAAAWFLLIGPQRSETGALQEQIAGEQARIATLQRRLAELERQKNDAPRYVAQLARDRQALPATDGMSDFLREIQSIGDLTHVAVSGVIVGAPDDQPGTTGTVFALPIAMTANGKTAALNEFLRQLQQVQPRAVLITNASLSAVTDDSGKATDNQSLTLSLKAFVAPDVHGGAAAAAPGGVAGTPAGGN